MTYQNNKTNNNKSLIKRWRDGDLRDSQMVTNTALVVILLIAAAFAWHIIQKGTPKTFGYRNSNKLINQVKTQGLDNFLPDKQTVKYYLVHDNGQLAGYAITAVTPETVNDKTFYVGYEVYMNSRQNLIQSSYWQVSNNLDYYKSITNRSYKSKPETETQLLENGILICQSGKYVNEPIRIAAVDGFIPHFLTDMFTSLALEQKDCKFNYVGPKLVAMNFTVNDQANIPNEFINNWSEAQKAASFHRIKEFTPARFDLLYDKDHFFLMKSYNNTILESVSLAELIDKLPGLRLNIQKELRSMGIENDIIKEELDL